MKLKSVHIYNFIFIILNPYRISGHNIDIAKVCAQFETLKFTLVNELNIV